MTCEYLTNKPGHCWCGTKLTGRQRKYCSRTHARLVVANHRWTQARAEAKKRQAFWACERCGNFFQKVEVNHIEPCKGKHGVWGCWHHQDNLEVLCVDCHKATTAKQREEGKI